MESVEEDEVEIVEDVLGGPVFVLSEVCLDAVDTAGLGYDLGDRMRTRGGGWDGEGEGDLVVLGPELLVDEIEKHGGETTLCAATRGCHEGGDYIFYGSLVRGRDCHGRCE